MRGCVQAFVASRKLDWTTAHAQHRRQRQRERENGERGGGIASTVSRAGISGYEGFCLGAVAGELEKR